MHFPLLWFKERLFPTVFRLPPPFQVEMSGLLAAAQSLSQQQSGDSRSEADVAQHDKLVATVATSLWTINRRITETPDQDSSPVLKRHSSAVKSAMKKLKENEIEFVVYTDELFDDAMIVDVLAWEPSADVLRETIIETTRPGVLWRRRRIQRPQVVVASVIDKAGKPKDGEQ